jgi:hypothetical protein
MNRSTRPTLVLILFFAMVSLAVVLVLRYTSGVGGVETDTVDPVAREGRYHSLGEAGQADFLTVFIYDAEGNVASYMVGGSTREFAGLADAVRGAREVDGQRDDSFTDLLVFSYSDNSTLELPFSPATGMFASGERLYRPAGDIAPMIEGVVHRFD